jgi:hypothetical protein
VEALGGKAEFDWGQVNQGAALFYRLKVHRTDQVWSVGPKELYELVHSCRIEEHLQVASAHRHLERCLSKLLRKEVKEPNFNLYRLSLCGLDHFRLKLDPLMNLDLAKCDPDLTLARPRPHLHLVVSHLHLNPVALDPVTGEPLKGLLPATLIISFHPLHHLDGNALDGQVKAENEGLLVQEQVTEKWESNSRLYAVLITMLLCRVLVALQKGDKP